MTPNLHSFADELTKVARIFGASPHENADWAEIPYEKRLEAHRAYLAAKGGEDPTSYGKAMGVGGLTGGLTGGAIGALAGLTNSRATLARGLKGGVIGGLGGLTVGALLGALAAKSDRSNIQGAKDVVAGGGEEDDLHGEISSRRAWDQYKERSDRMKLHSIDSDYDYGHGKGLGKKASVKDILHALAVRAAPGAAVGAGVGGVRGIGDEGAVSGAAKGALVGALLGIPLSHGAERIGNFSGKHLAAREVASKIGIAPYHKMTSAQRKAIVDVIGDQAKPAQDLVTAKLKRAGAIGAGVTGGVMATRNK